MIKLQIIGHLGKDAVLNVHGTDAVLNFSVAHTDKYKDGNGQLIQKTTWVSCSYWIDSQSTLGQYLKKGVVVFCEGFPEARGYEHSGKIGGELKMRVHYLQLCGGSTRREDGEGSVPTKQAPSQETVPSGSYKPIDDDNDLPF